MQRERTALKVMQQMLVARRDVLTIDDVVPVGDAFDYLLDGQQPLDAHAAARFRSAAALYREKLRPLMLDKYGLTEADAADAADAGALPTGFRADDRLVKTLLLSAVAPKVPALKELTGTRLASLNHGSIRSPLPGSESSIVLGKVREWSRRVPEIRVGSEPGSPVIRVQLSDVDYQSVVERARGEDNEGRRRELIRDLVREALGVAGRDTGIYGAIPHPVIWRGSRREVDIVFGNVRDATWLTDDHFRARPGTWRIVIDHPFDQAGHSGAQDLARLDRMIDGGLQSRTIAWLPKFLSDERMTEVRRLVILDWLLGGRGRAVDRVRRSPVRGGPGPGPGDPGRSADGVARGPAARHPGVLRRGGTDSRHPGAGRLRRPHPGQPGSELLARRARRRRSGRRVRQPGGPGVQRHLLRAPQVRAGRHRGDGPRPGRRLLSCDPRRRRPGPPGPAGGGHRRRPPGRQRARRRFGG